MRYCPTDREMVQTEKEFSWPWALAWFVLGGGIGILVYLIYYAFKSESKCVRCGSDTLSSPPPGYVENPNTDAQYIPEEVATRQANAQAPGTRQGQHHLSQGSSGQALPSQGGGQGGGHGAGQGAASGTPSGGEDWEDVSPMGHTVCPNCNQQFAVEKRRPLNVTCPACGTSGRLPDRSDERGRADQVETFDEGADGRRG